MSKQTHAIGWMLALAGWLLLTPATDAGVMTVTASDMYVAQLRDAAPNDGLGDTVNQDTNQVLDVTQFGSGLEVHAAWAVLLPSLPVGHTIQSITFSVARTVVSVGGATPTHDVDLYVLRTSASPTFSASDYQAAGGTLASANFDMPSLSDGTRTSQDISNFVTYADNQYLILGLLSDPLNLADNGTTRGYRYGTIDANDRPGSGNPVLTITTAVPEPASLAFVTFGALLIASRGRGRICAS